MVVKDIWGNYTIEQKYEKIINTDEFQDLKNKLQLGLNTNCNANHTRYQHSLGTYYLACKLVTICKEKFSNILTISLEDEEAIKCAALLHDLGHGFFSNVSENFLEGTHEERTVSILLDKNSQIHNIIIENFGETVLEKILDLIKMKEKIKNKEYQKDNTDLMLIIRKLLSGGIDIDRLDYINRDSINVFGEKNDYSSILDYITLENIDDSLEVVFSDEAEYLISNFFNKRFELYDNLYLSTSTKILEEVFGKFLTTIKKVISWQTSDIEMKNLFGQYRQVEDIVTKRYANLLLLRKIDESFQIKEWNNEEEFTFFKKRIKRNIPELSNYSSCVFESSCKISIYSQKNKIFINKNGLIQDLSDCSQILNCQLQKERHTFAIDLYLLEELLKKEKATPLEIKELLDKIKSFFLPEIEQEKKYVFNSKSTNPKEEFNLIAKKIGLKNPKQIENCDIYYDYNNILENSRIAVRKRTTGNVVEFTVKKPLNDQSSISKREEKNFSSLDEILNFLQTEWKIEIPTLEEKVILNTTRTKYNLEYKGGIFEIAFDKTIPIFKNEKYKENYMIECELKKGNSSGLYLINQMMKEYTFIEKCNSSKKEIALEIIKESKKEN